MLRLLIVFLVLDGAVKCDECVFPDYDPTLPTASGFISTHSSINEVYSILFIKIEAINKVSFHSMYTDLIKHGVVPEILGASFSKSKPNRCTYFFKNVYTFNIRSHSDVPAFQAAFNKLLSALKDIGYNRPLNLDYSSFVYDIRTNTYLFVDIIGLITAKEQKDFTFSDKYADELFFDLIIRNDISVLKSHNFKKPEDQSSKFYYEEYRDRYGVDLHEDVFSIEDKIEFAKDPTDPPKLEVKVETRGSDFVLTAKIRTDIKTLTFSSRLDSFFVYVCEKQENKNTKCMNLKEEGKGLSWDYDVRSDLRIDVEVLDAHTEYGNLNINFYKVYLILTPKNDPGVISENDFFVRMRYDLDRRGVYIICETNHRDLRIGYFRDKDIGFKAHTMKSNPLKNRTGYKIYQANFWLFPEISYSCLGNHKKIFIMKKHEDESKFLVADWIDDDDKSVTYLSFVTKPNSVYTDTLMKCNRPSKFSNLFRIIKYDYGNHSYSNGGNKAENKFVPDKQILISHGSEPSLISEICLEKLIDDKSLLVNYELEDFYSKYEEKEYFLNFNSLPSKYIEEQKEKSKLNVYYFVYLVIKTKSDVIDLNFKNFEYPEKEANRIYISFKLLPDNSYEARVFFTDEKAFLNQIKNKKNPETNELIFTTKPTKVLIETKTLLFFYKTNTLLLEKLNCQFLSKSEIIYSFKLEDFDDCHPYLESVKDQKTNDNINIKCSTKDLLNPFKKRGEEYKLSDSEADFGIKRVYYTASYYAYYKI